MGKWMYNLVHDWSVSNMEVCILSYCHWMHLAFRIFARSTKSRSSHIHVHEACCIKHLAFALAHGPFIGKKAIRIVSHDLNVTFTKQPTPLSEHILQCHQVWCLDSNASLLFVTPSTFARHIFSLGNVSTWNCFFFPNKFRDIKIHVLSKRRHVKSTSWQSECWVLVSVRRNILILELNR